MKFLEQRALRGPNRYSRYPTIFMLLDIKEFEEQPSDTIPGFPLHLKEYDEDTELNNATSRQRSCYSFPSQGEVTGTNMNHSVKLNSKVNFQKDFESTGKLMVFRLFLTERFHD